MKRKTLVLPLRINDFSDSSQVVSVLARDVGLLDGLAKGSYRPSSSFQGPFDLAVVYEIVFIERRSSGLALFTESTVVDGLRGLRRSWARHVAASHVIEFLRVVATTDAESGALFDLALETLGALERSDDEEAGVELLAFDLQALGLLGLLPPVSACVHCGRQWPGSSRPVFFSIEWAGLVCRACRESRGAGRGRELAGSAVRVLEQLAAPRRQSSLAGSVRQEWKRHRPQLGRTVGELRTRLLECELTVLQSAGIFGSS